MNVETLGEYPTSISRIQLKDLEGDVVLWEVEASGGVPQIWGVHLSHGANSAILVGHHGHYQTLIPRGSSTFVLYKDREYQISVWGVDGTRSASARFVL